MNVLVVASALPSKKYPLVGIFEFDQAKALSDYGNDVTYFAIDLRSIRRFRKFGILYEKRENVDCYTISLPLGRAPIIVSNYLGSVALKLLYRYVYSLKKQPNPDVIHAHFTMPAYASASLVKSVKVPLVVTEHSSNLLHDNCPKNLIECATFAYGTANQVISVSDYLGEAIYIKTGIKTKTIFNIVDLGIFKNTVRKEHDGFRYVVVANLVESKSHELLLHAFSDVANINRNIHLDIIGDGPLRERLVTMIKDLGLESIVTMHGQLERRDMLPILEKCDCFVLPSQFETFGVVYIEAMAMGLPVIATKCGGPEGFVINEVGKLVEKDDREALAQAMIDICENYSTYNSDKIKSYAINRFSPEIIAKQINDVYMEIV